MLLSVHSSQLASYLHFCYLSVKFKYDYSWERRFCDNSLFGTIFCLHLLGSLYGAKCKINDIVLVSSTKYGSDKY